MTDIEFKEIEMIEDSEQLELTELIKTTFLKRFGLCRDHISIRIVEPQRVSFYMEVQEIQRIQSQDLSEAVGLAASLISTGFHYGADLLDLTVEILCVRLSSPNPGDWVVLVWTKIESDDWETGFGWSLEEALFSLLRKLDPPTVWERILFP